MPFKGSVPFPYIKDHFKLPTVTLREAAQTGRDNVSARKVVKINIVLVELLDLIATGHCNTKSKSCANQMESNCAITGITKLEQSTTKKAYKTQPKSGKAPAKNGTATSVSMKL